MRTSPFGRSTATGASRLSECLAAADIALSRQERCEIHPSARNELP